MIPGTELHFHTRSPTDMPEQNLTPETLAAALRGLEARRARLDAHIAEVRSLLGARPQQPAARAEAPKRKRRMSAAGRRRIATATKKRWADYHQKKAEAAAKAKEPAAVAKAPRPKRKLNAAGRKRIVKATRKRWAEYRRKQAEAAKGAGKPAVMKKAAVKSPGKAAKKTAAKGPKKAAVKAATQSAAADGASE